MSQTVVPGGVSEFKVRTLGERRGDGSSILARDTTSSVDRYGVGSGDLGVETMTDFHQDKL